MNTQDALYEARRLLSLGVVETDSENVRKAYLLISAIIDWHWEMATRKKMLEDFFGKENIHTLREDLERERGESK